MELYTRTLAQLQDLENAEGYETLVTSVVKMVPDMFRADTCSVMSLDRKSRGLKIDGAHGLHPKVVNGTVVKKGERICGWVLENNRSIRLGKRIRNGQYRNFEKSERVGSAICVPLALQGRPFGVLNIGRLTANSPFTAPDHAAADTVAFRISSALERVRLKKELKRARTTISSMKRELKLYENTSSLQFIAGTVAHDINNPLTVISGHAELLKEKTRDKYARVCLEFIMAQSAKIRDITRSLTEYMEAGTCSHRPLSVVECMHEALSHNRNILEDSGITVVFNPVSVPETSGSAILLERVFTNLIVNAVRAMVPSPEKRLEISVRPDDREIRLAFRDTGPGITRGLRGSLFKPLRTTRKDCPTVSHGWGLPICKKIIKEHKGTITVTNHRDGGAVFTISLPVTGPTHERKNHAHHSRRI